MWTTMQLIWLVLLLVVDAAPCKDNQQCDLCDDNGWCESKCYDGYYGFKCIAKCSTGCRNNRCHLTNNGNDECSDGCNLGFYGTRCSIPCETHENTCRKCPQECEGGFCQLGPSCAQGCQDSYYGTACRSCPAWCEVCNRVSGTCEVCLHCEGDCTHGCLEGCTTGYFGDFCEHTCSSGCLSGCDQSSGDCVRCKSGWYGATCDEQCSKRCLDENCDMEGICTHGCTEGWFGSRCASKCPASCLGDTCYAVGGLIGVMCESKCGRGCAGGTCTRSGVCIDGCKAGFYGEQCRDQCPASCFNRLCDIEDGTCQSCEKDFYGINCDKSCVRCVDGSCRQYTGICKHGCLSKYSGEFCQHDCTGNCNDDECHDVCQTGSYALAGEEKSNYVPYWVAAAVVLIVTVPVIFGACRIKRLQSVIYGSMKRGQRQEVQPPRDHTGEANQPTVNLYCELDEEAMKSPQLPGQCGIQVDLASPSASPPTSLKSRQDAGEEERSNSPASASSTTEPTADVPAAHREGTRTDGARADSDTPVPSDRDSYLTAFVPNTDTSPPPYRRESQIDIGAATRVYSKARGFDERPLLNGDKTRSLEHSAGGNPDSNRAYGVGTSKQTIESAEDGEVDEELSNISVPVIADCYDNFSVDDDEEAVPAPPHENYSKLFTTNY